MAERKTRTHRHKHACTLQKTHTPTPVKCQILRQQVGRLDQHSCRCSQKGSSANALVQTPAALCAREDALAPSIYFRMQMNGSKVRKKQPFTNLIFMSSSCGGRLGLASRLDPSVKHWPTIDMCAHTNVRLHEITWRELRRES